MKSETYIETNKYDKNNVKSSVTFSPKKYNFFIIIRNLKIPFITTKYLKSLNSVLFSDNYCPKSWRKYANFSRCNCLSVMINVISTRSCAETTCSPKLFGETDLTVFTFVNYSQTK